MSILTDERQYGTDEERAEWIRERDHEYRKQEMQDIDRMEDDEYEEN